MLEDFVTDEGWLKAKKFRDSKRDGWTFEPLTESRQAWEQRYGPQTWNEAKEWGEDNCEAVLANGYAGRHRSYSQTVQRCEGGEYQEAKLTAVAMGHFDGKDFASQLERAIAPSKGPPPKVALLPPPEHIPQAS